MRTVPLPFYPQYPILNQSLNCKHQLPPPLYTHVSAWSPHHVGYVIHAADAGADFLSRQTTGTALTHDPGAAQRTIHNGTFCTARRSACQQPFGGGGAGGSETGD